MPRPGAPTDGLLCVTGASGFIGAHIVEDLLGAGYRVRGTVRDASSTRHDHLRSLPGADERLQLVTANLDDPATLEAAAAGCTCVLHTASPYVLDVDDPQRDLVRPAVEGTRGVLEACRAAGTVRRVVVTSSMAAVTDAPDEHHVLTEADWNTASSLTRNPYYHSKTLAEREAWRFAGQAGVGFDVVAINPFIVIGPSHSDTINVSNRILVDILSGGYPGILGLTWGFVDVRDVARSHRLAVETPRASGRYLCVNEVVSMRELVELLRRQGYDGYPLPTRRLDNGLGDTLVRLGSYFRPKGTGSYLRTNIGRVPRFDTSKIRHDLDLDFRPLDATVRDTVDDLIRWGHVPEPTADG